MQFVCLPNLKTAIIAGIILLAGSRLEAAEPNDALKLLRTGKYIECIELSKSAIESADWAEGWWINKIRAELTTGQYPEALATYESAIERQSRSIQIRLLGRQVLLNNNRPDEAARVVPTIIGMFVESQARYTDPADRITFGQALLLGGEDARRVLEQVFDRTKKESPEAAEPFIASGDLALEKNDFALAAQAFEAAAKLLPDDPDIYLGLARSYENDAERIKAAIDRAIAINPKHVDTLLFQADNLIDQEAYEQAEAILKTVLEINPRNSRAWAYRAVLAHLAGKYDQEKTARNEALSSWKNNPEVDHLIGLKLSQKYRFTEGKAYQLKALEMSPAYQPAKVQLCQDLLRLGEEAPGWKLADEVFTQDPYNILAFNLTTLRDHLKSFKVLQSENFSVSMDAREADIYGSRVSDLLARAHKKLTEKYDVKLPEKVVVEIFPQQKDFAIRTFGLPGGSGFLGVCFGDVITVNSPASRVARPANWEAILWHEFCHAVTLNKSKNKMPRWLSEGISVYEETLENPAWGQSMNPQYREMILAGKATPLSKLSGAFLNAKEPMDIQFAYYESSMAVRYLVEKHGLEAIRKILNDLGKDIKINDAIAKRTEPIDKLDADFDQWLRTQAEQLATGGDLSRKDLPLMADSLTMAAWNEQHPKNVWGLLNEGRALLDEKKWQQAIAPLEQVVQLYPNNGEAGGPYLLLAEAYKGLNDTKSERAMLLKHTSLSGDAVEARLRLLEIATSESDWQAVKKVAEEVIAINPLIAAPNRSLAQAAEALKDRPTAILARRAILLMDPLDQSGQRYQLAKLLADERQYGPAKLEVLKSLEETPRFRDAQRLLLDIIAQTSKGEAK